MWLGWLTMIFLLIVLVGLLALLRKVNRIDRETWQLKHYIGKEVEHAESNLYRQIEALQDLHMLLSLPKPLPPLRGWAGSPDFLLELAQLVLTRRPAVVVECSSGASTVVLARCCQLNGSGHVYSLEHDPQYAAKTTGLVQAAGLEGCATVIPAPLKDTVLDGDTYPWYCLDGLPPAAIDLLVVDGPPGTLRPQARHPAGPLLIPRLSPGGVVVLDDADRPDEREIVSRWAEQFPGLSKQERPAEKGMAVLFQPPRA